MTGTTLRIAVLGGGTVGREVIRALVESAERLEAAAGRGLSLAGIAVRDLDAARDRGLPAELLTDAPAHLVAAADTDVVVELFGGDEPARTLMAAALEAGKPVVTANKHVLARHGADLEAIARRTGAALRFEAAVGGGIPVLSPIAADLAGNRIRRIRGIVNGTTNFILTEMAAGRGTYEAVLRDAQERGYAEADASADVEGRDAIDKAVILARLGFGAWLDPKDLADRPPSLSGAAGPGITGVTPDELSAADALGLSLRLVASVAAHGAGDDILASVVPTAVPADSPIGRTTGVRNRLEVRAEPVGDVGFDGPGAGGEATSSAVLGDLVAVSRGLGSTWAGLPPAGRSRAGLVGSPGAGPLAGTRRWFALLPGVRPDRAVRELAEAHTERPGGTAIRTGWHTLEIATSRILEAVPEGLDAPLYPIDD